MRAFLFAGGFLVAVLAADPATAFGQVTTSADPEVDTQPAVTDPFAPPGDFADIAPIQKAAGGPQWAFLGVSTDQQKLQGIFLSGTTASGTFPNCINATVPTWVITITRDGNFFATAASSNVWFNVDAASPPHCGVNFTISKGSNFEVLTPGTYQFHMQQNGTDVTASITVRACTAPVAMLSSRNDIYTDNFYTTSSSDWQVSQTTYGYHDTGIPFRVSRRNELVVPFKRFFKGAPQVEHFYTHLDSEVQTVISLGYTFETNEGNVFTSQLSGTLPLYRLSLFNGATGDLQHVYTTSTSDVSLYQSNGWLSDGIKGYVCPR